MSLRLYWPVVLALLAIFLQPFGRVVELPVLVMALVGLHDVIRNTGSIRMQRSFKILSALFLCFWLPALFSLPDAVHFEKSFATWLGILRFYLAGIFILSRLGTPESIRAIVGGIAFIALFWAVDNIFQAVTGFDFFGRPPVKGRIPGIFGDSPRSGWMLIPIAFVSALYFWQQFRRPLALVFTVVVFIAIILSGDRGAIIAVFWAVSALALFGFILGHRVRLKNLLIGIGVVAVACVSAFQVPQVAERFEKTTAVLEGGGYEAWDKATSRRLTLWSTAVKIVADNPTNGVGVRGFRYAYPDYAPDGDRYVDGGVGAYHAHQIVIELLADTGILGLVGYIIALGIFVWLAREATERKNLLALGYLASVVGVLMPLNSHLSFYSSYWAQACWFLFAATIAAVFYEKRDVERAGV
ncbi:O-antigen ligase family protein [Pontibacterium granulatum]|uniref:O-antigen ligase family protein n=1 Tax=Pontibacterium granulatum TaxID=2036029 RepID=UPI00249BA7BA|nr:O-antigen ligase family protein [Pontibacterium granulatum]MDI3324629.1 O-antigen ligase family protein [Pontibacterium granulatum]